MLNVQKILTFIPELVFPMCNNVPWQLNLYRRKQIETAYSICSNTCHLLKVNENGEPKPHASGVFVRIKDHHFLFTAGHVIDDCENEIYVGTHQGDTIYRFGGKWIKNDPNTTREYDRIDMAILEIDQDSMKIIGSSYQFIDYYNIDLSHVPRLLPMYVSVGFPCSKSKFNSYKNELKSTPFLYVTMCANDKIYKELGCDPRVNIIVNYDKCNVIDYSTGKVRNGPDLYGISGSGLWFVPMTGILDISNISKKLVAIMTEWPINNHKYMIGTRIDLFIDMLRRYDFDI